MSEHPRFRVLRRFTVPDEQGNGYLYRLRVIDTKWFGVYLHCIAGPDPDRDPHNHPANFRCLILDGSYIETRTYDGHRFTPNEYRRFQWNKLDTKVYHTIVSIDGPVWTLVLRGIRKKSWGFLTDKGHVDWTEYPGAV